VPVDQATLFTIKAAATAAAVFADLAWCLLLLVIVQQSRVVA
jgi:hypothetical protein